MCPPSVYLCVLKYSLRPPSDFYCGLFIETFVLIHSMCISCECVVLILFVHVNSNLLHTNVYICSSNSFDATRE